MPASKIAEKEETVEKAQELIAETITSEELDNIEFPELDYVLPGIIPEGSTILGGPVKAGKSYFALTLAASASISGYMLGSIQMPKIPTLYLALEDSRRRLQTRQREIKAKQPNPDLHLATEWKSGVEGLNQLDIWLKCHPDVKLVIIDTLQRFRGLSLNGDSYALDYDQLAKIKSFADIRKISILVLHHLRKSPHEDPVQMLSGTQGITGAVDTVLVLNRKRKNPKAKLFITGRDVEEQELAIRFEFPIGWNLLGDADEVELSDARREIMQVTEKADEPLSAKVISEALEKNYNTTRNLIAKMVQDGDLLKLPQGGYSVNPLT